MGGTALALPLLLMLIDTLPGGGVNVCRVPVPGEQHRHPQMMLAALADIGREPLADHVPVAQHLTSFSRPTSPLHAHEPVLG
ncbi:MAG TPA: hypothetical protein VEF71_26395 [Streptosporangiaceae bacterium]|nr:hypothetical protein [Streptosporangiaceae bacterium]